MKDLFDRLRSSLSPSKVGKELKQTFRSLSNRDYRVYSLGQVISLCGTWMQTVALSWLVYRLTGSAAALGMVSFASGMPLLVFTYFGGMIADRFDRRRILLTTQTLAMLQAIVLTFLTVTGLVSVPWIVALALIAGTITAVELPARQSFVPDLVGKSDLTNAIGINSAIWNVSRTIGPALGGVLIGIFGEAACFGFNAVSYLAALVSLLMLSHIATTGGAKQDGKTDAKPKDKKSDSIWPILMSPEIKSVLLLSAATSMFGFQYGVLLPVVADKVLGGGASTLGFLSAAAGSGALIGSLALANRGDSKILRRGIGFACLTLACAIGLIAYSAWLPLSFIAVAIAGACISIQLSGGSSLVQAVTEPDKRGRIMGVYSTFMVGFTPFAAMIAGWLAELIGVSFTLYVSALSVFVSALLYLAYTKKRLASLDDEGENK